MAETKKDALAAFDAFGETWGVKYDKAVACLTKDREALLAFFDFPAEHWDHLRTSNRSRAYLRRCVIEPCGPREPCRPRPPSSWCSNSSTPPQIGRAHV